MVTINKLYAGAEGNPLNSTGAQVATSVNALIDYAVYSDVLINTLVGGKSNTDHGHSLATNSSPGFLSASDKDKLDSITYGAGANSSDSFLLARANHTGLQPISTVSGLQAALDAKSGLAHVHTNATNLVAGFMSPEDKAKLSSVAANSSANSSDSFLLSRANHTGFQPIASVTGLQTALDSKSGTAHTHTVATNIADGFLSKEDKIKLDALVASGSSDAFLLDRANHTGVQPIATVSGLQEALDLKSSSAHGHGSATISTAGFMSAVDKIKLDSIASGAKAVNTDAFLLARANHTGTQSIASVQGLEAALTAKQPMLVAGTNITIDPATWTISSIGGGGGGGTSDHSALTNRNAANQHTISSITGLVGELDAKAPILHPHNVVSGSDNGFMSSADKTKLDGISTLATANQPDVALLARENHTGFQSISTITSLQTSLDSKLSLSGGVMSGRLVLPPTFVGNAAMFNIPNIGTTDPTTLVNGDLWQRSNLLYVRLNGVSSSLITSSTYSTIAQAEAEAGTSTTVRWFTAERVKQAVAAQAVLPTRTINSKALSSNIVLTSTDVSARADTWVPSWSDVSSKPTTLSGFSITDAVSLSGDQTIAGTKTFSSSLVVSGALITSNALVGRAFGTEGGQLVLGYAGSNTIVGQANSTWNMDVDVSNSLRFFRLDSSGNSLIALSLDEATGQVTSNYRFRVGANMTNAAAINIASQGTTDPTTLVNGDLWHRSDTLYARLGGTTRTMIHNGNPSSLAPDVSQADMEVGSSSTRAWMTPLRVRQAITAYPEATQSVKGLMSPSDKTKLDTVSSVGVSDFSNSFSIPTPSTGVVYSFITVNTSANSVVATGVSANFQTNSVVVLRKPFSVNVLTITFDVGITLPDGTVGTSHTLTSKAATITLTKASPTSWILSI